MGRTKLQREVAFIRGEIDRDDGARARRNCTQKPRKADAAKADDRAALAGLQPARVQHRADAGQHRAAQKGRLVERDRLVDLHAGGLGDDCVIREGRDADMVVHMLARDRDAFRSGDQAALARRDGGRLAKRRPPLGAGHAMAAGRREDENDVIARREASDMRADRLDHARRLMAQRHGHVARAVAVDDGQVRVAQAGSRHLDEQLTRAGIVQLGLDDLQRLAVGIRARFAHFAQKCDPRFHSCSSPKRFGAAWESSAEVSMPL